MTYFLPPGGLDRLSLDGDVGDRCLIVDDTVRLIVRVVDGDGMESVRSSSSSSTAPPGAWNGNGLFSGCLTPVPNRFLLLPDLGGSGRGGSVRWSLSMVNMGLTGVAVCLLLLGYLDDLGLEKPHSRESRAARRRDGFLSLATVVCFGFAHCFARGLEDLDIVDCGEGARAEFTGLAALGTLR